MHWKLCYDDDKATHERIMPNTLVINIPLLQKLTLTRPGVRGKNFCGKREVSLSQRNMIWKTDLQSPWLANITSFICIWFFLNGLKIFRVEKGRWIYTIAAIVATLKMSRLLQNCYLSDTHKIQRYNFPQKGVTGKKKWNTWIKLSHPSNWIWSLIRWIHPPDNPERFKHGKQPAAPFQPANARFPNCFHFSAMKNDFVFQLIMW